MKKNRAQPLLHVGRASDLSGSDRALYRFFECIPAFLSVGTLVFLIVLSFTHPTLVAYFTIAFAAYWLFKTLFLTFHLRHNFRRLTHHMALDWSARIENLKYQDIRHVVIFPFYKEPYSVLVESVAALSRSRFPLENIMVVLAAEERAGEDARAVAERIKKEYDGVFCDIHITIHPKDLPHEIPGKGSNIAYAAKTATTYLTKRYAIDHTRTLVSAFDSDTVVYPDYFACLTWHFLTAEQPLRSSFQPVPLYNNNIWDAPLLSRVLAYASTFWQMIQQERPERLSTFSSHAVPLSALVEADYWQRNMVNEDSRIFFNLFMFYNGDYRVVPISYPVSMDANVAHTFGKTLLNLYKQHLRWMYGAAENVPYLLYHFVKNSRIPLKKKILLLSVHIEGAWSLVVQPIVLFGVGWLPLFLGGAAFNQTVLSYNLPIVSSWFLTAAMVGLIFLAMYSVRLIPPRPQGVGMWKSVLMFGQWIVVPITMLIFSALPGLDAQLRLAGARYLGFWVTPKTRDGVGAVRRKTN